MEWNEICEQYETTIYKYIYTTHTAHTHERILYLYFMYKRMKLQPDVRLNRIQQMLFCASALMYRKVFLSFFAFIIVI